MSNDRGCPWMTAGDRCVGHVGGTAARRDGLGPGSDGHQLDRGCGPPRMTTRLVGKPLTRRGSLTWGARSIPNLQTADEMPALIEVELVHQPYGYSYSISGMDHGLLTVRQSRLLWCPGGSTDPTAQWGNEVVVPRGVLQRTSASVRMPPVVALSPELWSTSPGVWRRGRQLSGPKRGLPAQPLLVD